MMICSKCKGDVPVTKNIAKCVECGAIFHAACCRIRTASKLSSMSAQTLAVWRCDTCAQETDSLASGKSDSDDPKLYDILQNIQRDIASGQLASQEGFKAVNDRLTSMQQTLSQFQDKLNMIERENVAVKEECGKLLTENVALNKKVNCLETEIEDLKQYSRNRNVEIRGIPLTKNENVYEVLECVAKALGITFNRSDISIAHRLPAPRGKSFPPSIIAQFVSRTTRAEWMTAAKHRRIQTTDLAASLRPAPVLLVDHLTPSNRRLLGHAKSLVKDGQLAYAWVKEGKVMVRRTADGPVKRMTSREEVDDFVRSGGTREARDPGNTHTSA